VFGLVNFGLYAGIQSEKKDEKEKKLNFQHGTKDFGRWTVSGKDFEKKQTAKSGGAFF
jgi:hypothetical protein